MDAVSRHPNRRRPRLRDIALPLTIGRPDVDLNYILGRHQFALAASSTAASAEARLTHRAFALGYAERIRAFQRKTGANARLVDGI